jgi:hypothetical protein
MGALLSLFWVVGTRLLTIALADSPRLANVPCAPPELSFLRVILLSGCHGRGKFRECNMHGLIYLIGLIVVILFILSLLGLR